MHLHSLSAHSIHWPFLINVQINPYCDNIDRGEPLGNGSWDGILGLLRDDKCDFVVGGFFPDFEVYGDFGTTATYLENSYTW